MLIVGGSDLTTRMTGVAGLISLVIFNLVVLLLVGKGDAGKLPADLE